MAKNSPTKTVEPRLMLHGRILYRDRQGGIRDVTEADMFGLKKFAQDGATALYILDQCRKRLGLLFMAAEHRSQMDAELVRLAVQDIRIDLEDGGDLRCYLHGTQEMFEHSEALLPLPTPNTRDTRPSMSLVKPAS